MAVLLFIMAFTSQRILAQKNMQAFADLQCLKSTHGNNFWGISIAADKRFSTAFSMGIGLEYSYAHQHFDNGWILNNLNFFPVYIEQRCSLNHLHTVNPYLHFEEGISFNKYDKSIPTENSPTKILHEDGFYGYTGIGFRWELHKKSAIFTEVGIKSFRTTNNNLDVNPHGLTLKLGYRI